MVARIAKRAELASAATALVVVVAAAACFYLPALAATGGRWPVPLDDVYIYFGFARSAALGHPFEWLPGNGYSSGATAVLYPLVLAPFWAAGLRGSSLGVAAALVAVSGLVVLARALASLGCRRGAAPYLPALLLVSVPLVNWSWFSGMETGLFALFLGRALVATQAAVDCDKSVRRRAQLRAGIWFALLVITRPEALVLAAALAVAVAHGARSLWTLASLARAAAPAILTLALQFTANHAVTGEWQSAGAVRKLVTEAPFLTAEARAIEVAKNLLVLASEALWRALGGAVGVAAFGTLVLAAMVLRARRRLAVSLAVGSLGALVLVCLNTTARYQNYRYAAPSLAMLLCAAILGFSAISGRISAKFGAPRPASFRAQGRRMSLGNSARTVLAETPARVFPMPLRNSARTGLAVALAAIAIAAPAHELPPQVAHFTRASVNILEQHAEVAHRLARMTPPARRVLVGDAGAIPYLSKLAAIDALGLGGYHALPFARASLHGAPAIVELIERLPLADRPDVMALYPSWFAELIEPFGTRLDSVRIQNNVICAADEKVIYRADWSLLSAPEGEPLAHAIARLDLADLVDERAFDTDISAPRGGFVIAATHQLEDGTMRYDAGRAFPIGVPLAFTAPAGLAAAPTALFLRTDAARDPGLQVTLLRESREIARVNAELERGDGWSMLRATDVPLRTGDRLRLHTRTEDARLFQIWLTRP